MSKTFEQKQVLLKVSDTNVALVAKVPITKTNYIRFDAITGITIATLAPPTWYRFEVSEDQQKWVEMSLGEVLLPDKSIDELYVRQIPDPSAAKRANWTLTLRGGTAQILKNGGELVFSREAETATLGVGPVTINNATTYNTGAAATALTLASKQIKSCIVTNVETNAARILQLRQGAAQEFYTLRAATSSPPIEGNQFFEVRNDSGGAANIQLLFTYYTSLHKIQ